jgi:sortase A
VAVRGLGRMLIAMGTLILLFVVYELWGTNIAEARSQRTLKKEFLAQLARPAPRVTVPATTAPPVAVPTTVAVATSAPPDTAPPPVPTGEAVAIIKIPRIGVEKAVVEGVGVPDLKKGPGHYPGTPLPGQPGNAAIAGHRTTYGAPFNRIDELQPGDPIIITTRQGRFRYEVMDKKVVRPSDVSVLQPTADNRLTMTTCNPKYSAAQRLVVISRLVGTAAEAPALPPPPPAAATGPGHGPPTTVSGPARADQPTVSLGPGLAGEGPAAGLSGATSARTPAVLWGLVCALFVLGVWLLGRGWRRWPAYLLGTPVFLVLLYFFFENVSRLLPANI